MVSWRILPKMWRAMISVDRQKVFDTIKQKVTKPNHMQLFSQLCTVCSIWTSAWWTGEAGQRNPSFSLLGRTDLRTRKGGRDSRFSAAFSLPSLRRRRRRPKPKGKNARGKWRTWLPARRCVALDGGCQVNPGSVIPNEQHTSYKASLYLEQLIWLCHSKWKDFS